MSMSTGDSRLSSSRRNADLAAVTVRQLIGASPWSRSAILLAGDSGLDGRVIDVIALGLEARVKGDRILAGSLVVFDGRSLISDNYQIDVAIRVASERAASAVVLCAQRAIVPVSALKLADKLRMPLILEPEAEVLRLAEGLRGVVKQPSVARSDLLLTLLERLDAAGTGMTLDRAFDSIAASFPGPLALTGPEGSTILGDSAAVPSDWGEVRQVPIEVFEGEDVVVTRPLTLAPNEPASFWLTARLHTPTAAEKSLVSDLLLMSGWYVSARMVQDRLQRERDARFRLGILSSILDSSERAEGPLRRQLATLGWHVDGWCTGIILQASGEADPLRVLLLTEDLNRQLVESGIRGPLVERPDGWTFWVTEAKEPSAEQMISLTERLGRAVELVADRAPRLHLHGGLGRSYQGLNGLQASLSEAKEASVVAQAAGGRSGVQHIDALGVRRILLGWYASESFAAFAASLLAPVTEHDGDGQLLATLETYLDSESSATLTAAALGVHRNTVINRVERLRTLLTVNLEEPEERLAVQLACRVAKLKALDEPRTTR
jgi:hypothetical protein